MDRARVNQASAIAGPPVRAERSAAAGRRTAIRAAWMVAFLGLLAWGALAEQNVGGEATPAATASPQGAGGAQKPAVTASEKGTNPAPTPATAASQKSPGEAPKPTETPAANGAGAAPTPAATASEKNPGGAEKPRAAVTNPSSGEATGSPAPPTLEQMRLTMSKWIEIRQIISKERRDWKEGKEMLQGRIELVKKEIITLREKISQAESGAAETEKKRDELLAENDQLKATSAKLTEVVAAKEGEIRRLYKMLPEPVQTQIQPLYQRIPEDTTQTRISVAERFQNVLGILNELNKANNEIAVKVEVRNLADGKPAEVQVLYVGLGQAYYLSASGYGGVGRPTADGWKWEPSSKDVASNVLTALEIFQGKQTAAFVPLPVKLK